MGSFLPPNCVARQHARVIMADRAIEEDVDRFDAKPKVTHFIYAHRKTQQPT
jgi:hypothetical protein